MGDRLVAKYSNLVWKCVDNFCAKNSGYGNITINKDDLYQECIVNILKWFASSGKSIDEFRFNTMDLNNVMCRWVMQGLPVTVPIRTTDYKKRVCAYGNHESFDALTLEGEYPSIDEGDLDADFRIDCVGFSSNLTDKELKVFTMLTQGEPHTEIMKQLGVTRESIRWIQKILARKWNEYMSEQHLYYGRKV